MSTLHETLFISKNSFARLRKLSLEDLFVQAPQWLRSSNIQAKQAIISALAQTDHEQAIDLLLESFLTSRPGIRTLIQSALSQMENPARNPKILALVGSLLVETKEPKTARHKARQKHKEHLETLSLQKDVLRLIADCKLREAKPVLQKMFHWEPSVLRKPLIEAVIQIGDEETFHQQLQQSKDDFDAVEMLELLLFREPTFVYESLQRYFTPEPLIPNQHAIAEKILWLFGEEGKYLTTRHQIQEHLTAEPRWITLLAMLLKESRWAHVALECLIVIHTEWLKTDHTQFYQLLSPALTKESIEAKEFCWLHDSLLGYLFSPYGKEKKLFVFSTWREYIIRLASDSSPFVTDALKLLQQQKDPALPALALPRLDTHEEILSLLEGYHHPQIAPVLLQHLQKTHSLSVEKAYQFIRAQKDVSVLSLLESMLSTKQGKEREEIQKTIKALQRRRSVKLH